MLKQSGGRNHRYKDFKVKHVLQICALLALCIWLLNQAKSTTDKKGIRIFGKVTSENGVVKLGRKELNPQVDSSENGAEDEVEDSKSEEIEDDARGGGDDEIDGSDREKAVTEDELEDIIDEDDREKENQIEDLSLMEDQTLNEGDESLQDSGEEMHKSEDASTVSVKDNLDTTEIATEKRRLLSVRTKKMARKLSSSKPRTYIYQTRVQTLLQEDISAKYI